MLDGIADELVRDAQHRLAVQQRDVAVDFAIEGHVLVGLADQIDDAETEGLKALVERARVARQAEQGVGDVGGQQDAPLKICRDPTLRVTHAQSGRDLREDSRKRILGVMPELAQVDLGNGLDWGRDGENHAETPDGCENTCVGFFPT